MTSSTYNLHAPRAVAALAMAVAALHAKVRADCHEAGCPGDCSVALSAEGLAGEVASLLSDWGTDG